MSGHPAEPGARRQPIQPIPGDHHGQPDRGHHGGHPQAEGDDEDEPERGPARDDRAEEDEQGARRGDQAAGQAQREEAAPAERRVSRRERASGATPPWECSSGCSWSCSVVVARDRARGAVGVARSARVAEPRGTASSRRSPRSSPPTTTGAARATTSGGSNPCAPTTRRSQHEDAERVGDRHRQPETRRVERRTAGPDEVGRHQRLAVAGRQGMARPRTRTP